MREPVVVLTGAGVSTASGVPDFRGPQGIYTRFDPDEFHITRFHADPVRFWDRRVAYAREMRIGQVRPNAAHDILARAAQAGAVSAIVTQNIDGLHQEAGTPPDALLEVHGNGARCVCLACGATESTPKVVEGHVPGKALRCPCGGIWKPDVVLFGEPVTALAEAQRLVGAAKTLVAVGTSLQVWPVAGLVSDALSMGHDVVIVNAEATPFDDRAARVLRGDVVDGLRTLFVDV